MSESELFKARRTAKSDPALGRQALFSEEIIQRLAAELPPEVRATLHFTRATMPAHWLEAVLQNGESYRRRDKSVAMDFQSLSPAMTTEFAWAIERQVQLGMNIDAEATTKLAQQIAFVAAGQRHGGLASLLDLSCDEWIHAIRKIRIRRGDPLAPNQLNRLRSSLGRFLDILVHAYHQGDWWELNVWNPVLDTRIPLRPHEPRRHNLVYFSHLTTPWLREAAKWWLARQLEREVFVWTTVHTRQHNLVWFQRYLDRVGCDGPHLTDDERQLSQWVQDFRQWLGRQKCAQGPTKGQPLGPTHRRAAMTAPEGVYRFLFEERQSAVADLKEPRWLQLGPQHAALFRFGDKPSGAKPPPPDIILSDAVISTIAQNSELFALPKDEGGFGEEQLVRILGLLIRTGRRINEVIMLDFDPLVAIPFPDPDGHVARLRYQQTKIITADNTILVDQEVVDLIRQQQDYASAFMAGRGRSGVQPKYLFLGRKHNRNGDRNFPESTVHLKFAEFAKRIDLRDEQGKRIRISRTHIFRHTRATTLLNAGVPLHVAMRYMGHKTPTMFLHYAQTLSTVAEHEFLRYKKVTADGRDYQRDAAEMFEALALDRRTDRVLPNGYCTLPPRQACDKGNACLSCTKFVTDASFTEALLRQRDETRDLVQRRQTTHQATRDQHIREQLVSQLTTLIEDTDKLSDFRRGELRGKIADKPGLNRYLRTTPAGKLRIDTAKIKTEENLDGKYLLRCSDPDLSAEDIALGYKQLLEVERGWRDMKQIIDLRPVYHRLEERIRAHVVLCWLSLLLIRIIETTADATWTTVRRELDRLHLGTFTGPTGLFRQVTALTKPQRDLLAKLNIPTPKQIIALDPAPR